MIEIEEKEDFLDNLVEFSTELVAELSLSTDAAVVDMSLEAAPFTLSTDGVVVDVVVVEKSVVLFFFSPFLFPSFFVASDFSHASLRLIFF